MKDGIHPELHTVKVVCSCGHTFETLSTVQKIHVEVCSACHPFFTGKQKLLDAEGRVDRFKKRYAKRDDILQKQKQKGPRTITINN